MSKALEDYVTQLGQITLLKDATTKGSIRWYINWYEEHFPRARWKYRLAGVGVLLVALYAALGLKVRAGSLSVSLRLRQHFLSRLMRSLLGALHGGCISMPRSAWSFCCKRMRPSS